MESVFRRPATSQTRSVPKRESVTTRVPSSENASPSTCSSVTNSFVATTYIYDNANRMTQRTDNILGHPYTTTFGYDGNDNLTSVTYPLSSRTVNYIYDAANRVTSASDGSRTYASGVSYHPSGALLSFQSGNGIQQSFSYDDGQSWVWSCEQAESNNGSLYQMGPAPKNRLYVISSEGLALTTFERGPVGTAGCRAGAAAVRVSTPSSASSAAVSK